MSNLKINAGEFAKAVKFATGEFSKKSKRPFPVLIEKNEQENKIRMSDAYYHIKGMEIPYKGTLSHSVELDGRQLLNIADKYPEDAELEIFVDESVCSIYMNSSRLSIPRLDQGDKKTEKKPLPHKAPPPPSPAKPEKRAEYNDTWGFSARVPMPAQAVKRRIT